jgi:hypothetical protein
MKSMLLIQLALLPLTIIRTNTPPAPASSATLGVFVATSPCDALSRALLQIPATANCELIKWNLTLHQAIKTLAPTVYKLDYVYGLPEPGTNRVLGGGTKVSREGKWTTVTGRRTSPGTLFYQLDPEKPEESISFLRVDENLLHLLDRGKNLMVGNGGWSYTLNRNGDFGQNIQPDSAPSNFSVQPTSLTTQVRTGSNNVATCEMMPTSRFLSSTTGKLLSRVSTIICRTRVNGVVG